MLNYIFNHAENSVFTYGSSLNSEIGQIIDDVTKNTQFSNIEYKNKIKSILSSIEEKDSYIFTGPFLSGKSMALETISKVSMILNERNHNENPLVKYVKIFPKAYDANYIFSEIERFSQLQLYNNFFLNHLNLLNFDPGSKDDAIKSLRQSSFNFDAKYEEPQEVEPIKIICFDGLIDPLWIEYLNLINDNTKIHCMPQGDLIKLTTHKVIFETENLNLCTPTFITRNFIINFDQNTIKWENILFEFIATNKKVNLSPDLKNYIRGLFENYFPKLYEFILSNKATFMSFNENYVIKNFTQLFDAILPIYDFEDKKLGRRNLNTVAKIDVIKKSCLSIFIFSCAWTVSFFTNFILKTKVEKLISDIFKADDLRGPIFDYYIDEEKHTFAPWQDKLDLELYPELVDIQNENKKKNNGIFLYNKIFIPTIDNICNQWILKKYLKAGKQIFYTGKPGVGKSLLINDLLNEMDAYKDEVLNLRYLINYNSTSKKLESFLLDNLKYVKKDLIGDLYNRKVIFFVDDCNLQKADEYNSQSCLEYLRQITNTGNIYDMKTNISKRLDKFSLLCVSNLSSYGKNNNVDRFIHSFIFMAQNSISDESIGIFFKSTLEPYLKQFIPNTSSLTANQYITASLNVMNYVINNFKGTPNKLHYKFGIRDISKLFQSLINYKFKFNNTEFSGYFTKLWFNENIRIFEDKLSNESDVKLFRKNLLQIYNSALKQSLKIDTVINNKNIFFAYEIILPKNLTNNLTANEDPSKLTGEASDFNPNQSQNSIAAQSSNNINNNPEQNQQQHNYIENTHGPQAPVIINPREYIFWENTIELKKIMDLKYEEFLKIYKLKQFILNQEMFELLIKIIRNMHFNKGNLILITHTLAAQQLLVNFAAFIEGRTLCEIDETILLKDNKFTDEYIKKILLDVVYKNIEVVVYLNNKMLEKDEILEIINNLINTKEILTIFDKLKPEGEFKDVKLDESIIVSRLENNLSIIMSIFPNSIAYKKLYYNYTYISKHSSCIYVDKFTDETLYNLSVETIPELEFTNQKFGKFPKFLLEIHNYIISLALQYEEKLNFHIEISSKNFIDMITYYQSNYIGYRDNLLNQKKKLEFNCEVISKVQEIINKLNEELGQLEPQMNDNEKILNDKKSELIKKLGIKNNISNQKAEEEKPLNLLMNNLDRIQETIKENLIDTDKKVGTCTAALTNKLDKAELMEYRNIIENHVLSKYLLGQIYTIVGENSEWEYIKKNLDPKYIKSLAAKEYHNFPTIIVKIVRETVLHPEFLPDSLPRNLSATKMICDWFTSMDAYFTEYEKQKHNFDEIEEINKKIFDFEKSINLKTENIKEVQVQITELEKSISDNDRIKMNVGLKIKNRNDLKLICEELITTSQEKNDLWIEKKEALNKKLENLEFYLAFISCYLHYAPAFNFSFRRKIKNFFMTKAEDYGFLSIKQINFYTMMIEFIDLKKDKEIVLNLIHYDEFTKENLLFIHLSKKVPYLIDHNRISKWIIKDYMDKKENKKTLSVKQGDADLDDFIDRSMKEGMCLMIERVDSKIFDIFKNLILDNKIFEKGKTFVNINHTNKEINEKFKLFFVKDKIDTLIDSQIWLESLVINFIPCKEVLRGNLKRELLANEGKNLWNIYMKINTEIYKDNIKLMDLEEKINQILVNFDYSGSVEKNANNSGLLERLKSEYVNHSNLMASVELNNEKLVKYQFDIGKYDCIADEASRMFKIISKFTNVDNIYNFGFAVFIKYVKEFYNAKILVIDENQEEQEFKEYTTDNLQDMITFIYEKIALLYSYSDRRLMLLVLMLFYFQIRGDIMKSFKYIVKFTKLIFFDKKLDHIKYNKDSPIKNISQFQWNCLLEIDFKTGGTFLKIFTDHISSHTEDWNNYLEKDEMILKSNFLFFDSELESQINIFQRLIFFTIIKPHLFEQFIDFMKNTLFDFEFNVPRMNIKKALKIANHRKIICIIDNDNTSDKELITFYESKFMTGEIINVGTEVINLTTDLSQIQLDKILNGMKTGNLFILKNIQHLRNSVYRISDTLKDEKINVNEAFRLVFIGKGNIILPSIIYDQCFIINKNTNPLDLNIKESIMDLLDNIDINIFEYMINRKYSPVFSRKLFFHLLLSHSVLRLYQSFGTQLYNVHFKFDKKDFYYCLKFLKVYLEKIGDKEEISNNNPNNFNNNNYLSLINMCIETFYLNRLMYKEDYSRVNKLMQRFFEENTFMNEGYLMSYKNIQENSFYIKNNDAQTIDVLEDKYSTNEVVVNLNLEEVQNIIEKISLENYYDLVNNLSNNVINENLKSVAGGYFENLNKMNSIFIRSYKNMEINKLYNIEPEKFYDILFKIKDNLPEKIYFGEEASSLIFKLTKSGEYLNPMDEAIKFEVNKYNDFLVKIIEDMEFMQKIVKGEILFNDYYNNMIIDIYNHKLPARWGLHCFILEKDENNHVDINLWLENIKQRFTLLRKWLQIGSLEVFPLKLFYNFKLFMFSILNLFSRKAGVTPDEIHLKFFFTKHYENDENQLTSQKTELSANFKNKEIIYIEGIIIENAFYNNLDGKIYDNLEENKNTTTSQRCPIMGITYEMPYNKKDNSSIDMDVSFEDEIIQIPIYCRDDNNDDEEFENVEPVGHIELPYDNSFNEDYWISKGIKISSEY